MGHKLAIGVLDGQGSRLTVGCVYTVTANESDASIAEFLLRRHDFGWVVQSPIDQRSAWTWDCQCCLGFLETDNLLRFESVRLDPFDLLVTRTHVRDRGSGRRTRVGLLDECLLLAS